MGQMGNHPRRIPNLRFCGCAGGDFDMMFCVVESMEAVYKYEAKAVTPNTSPFVR